MSKVLRVDNEDNGDFGSAQFVETRIILPSSESNQQIRWLLPQAGIMSEDAFIRFRVTGSDANQRLPLWSGCMSFINSATLSYDGQIIATSRGINHLHTLKNFYRDPHNRNEKQSIRYGQFTGLMVDKCSSTYGIAGQNGAVGHWGMDIGQDYCDEGGATVADPSGQTRAIASGYHITNVADTTCEHRIYLSDIFPLIYHNGLPLGLLEGRFSIVLDLEQDNVRGQRTVSLGGTAWVPGNTVVAQPELCVDLTFYEDPPGVSTMDELRADLDKGQLISYTDYHYVISNQPLDLVNTVVSNNVLLGLDHQTVRRIFVSTPDKEDYAALGVNSGHPLLGNYYSRGSNGQASITGTNGGNTFNLKVNSVPVYPNDLNSDNKILDQLGQCFPEPFKQNSCIVSACGQVDNAGLYASLSGPNSGQIRLTNKTLNGVVQNLMSGCGHYYGCNLSKGYSNVLGMGTPIGRQSVVLTLTDMLRAASGGTAAQPANLGPKTLHIFAECERSMSIKNGHVLVTGS